MPLNVDACRSAFPQLADGLAYFENAGGSYVPEPVCAAMDAHLRRSRVQPSWAFPSSREAATHLEAGREALAALLGADADEVVVGPSTTLNVFVLAQALRAGWREGDAIVVTNQDHEANGGAWRRLAENGIEVREWRVDPQSGELDPAELERLLGSGRVRLVAFPHVSNVLASVNDVAGWTARAHAAGAQVCVDGVAYAPHGLIDVRGWGVDWYLFSAYKVYGPHVGVLYGRRERIAEVANQSHYFHEGSVPAKLNPGGAPYEAVAACAGMAHYLDHAVAASGGPGPGASTRQRWSWLFERVAEHEARVAAPIIDYLAAHSGVRLLGRATADRSERMPTIAFQPMGIEPRALAARLAEAGVAIGAGHFYAPRLLEAMGIDPARGVARISAVHTNTEQEAERLLRTLDGAL